VAYFIAEVEGIRLENVHPMANCAGRPCVIHDPSGYHMRGWPLVWRNDRVIFERTCPHGIGQPDPDQFEFWNQARQRSRPLISADIVDGPYLPGNPYDGVGLTAATAVASTVETCWVR
jgi:hypothetical protein